MQTAQIGRIAQDRIDRQWAARVIGAYFKANLTWALKHIPAGDVLLLASCFLVDAGLAEPDLPSPGLKHQIAARVHADLGFSILDFGLASSQFRVSIFEFRVASFNGQPNGLGVSARRHHKVVLQLLLVAVINQVDARIDVLVLHLGEGGNPGVPLLGVASDEVVGVARQPVDARDFRRRIGAHQPHAHHSRSLPSS